MSNPFKRPATRFAAVATALALVAAGAAVPAAAADADAKHKPKPGKTQQAQLETLDRGLVATRTAEGTFLSWRLLGNEATGYSTGGLTGADFAVYRDGTKVATVTDSTNWRDDQNGATYTVAPIVNGTELAQSAKTTPVNDGYQELPLQKPADGVTPAGEAYTYSANDMSVSDVDADGQYEYIVKWYPSNAKDVSQVGYTGNTYVDTYETDGTLLHRIDLGVNIRSGAHYTQVLSYDFDGDGKSEMLLQTAPGTTTNGKPITLPKKDVKAGFSNSDDYRLSADGYFDHLVEVFEGWSTHPEVVAGNWPATLEEAFGIPNAYSYPLSESDAAALADYFIDVYAPSRSARNALRAFEGFILSGPEYLTMFDGATGKELQTIPVTNPRVDDGLLWGDYAMARIEPGNRVDRYLGGVAYLDGEHPSAIFAHGYYTRTTIAAYGWNGKKITTEWNVDSGFTPMTNPFNDSPHGRDGTSEEYGTLTTQGFHSLSAADVDGDGKHEVVYGSATIDDDGSLLYSSFATMPEGSATPGEEARLGHGDSMHVTDIDPARPGLEIFTVHEGATYAPYGYALRDAATGEVLYGEYTGKDTGRGMIGDVDPTVPGIETWATKLRAASGEVLGTSVPGTNQSIRWAGDGTTQIVGGAAEQDVTINDWQDGVVLAAAGTRSNNGTKGTASLVADVFGDWREELLVRTADSSSIRIYFSTDVTDRKLYTLMHDKQYRAEVARQNTTYNQPSYPGFYLASDTDWAKVPLLVTYVKPAAPTFSDKKGTKNDSYRIPSTRGVQYYANGKPVDAGKHSWSSSAPLTVTAVGTGYTATAAGAKVSWSLN